MTPSEQEAFKKQLEEQGEKLRNWPEAEKAFQEQWPGEALCPICYLRDRDPQPNHLMILICPDPGAYLASYRWNEEAHALTRAQTYAVDQSAMEKTVVGAVEIYMDRGELNAPDLVPFIGLHGVALSISHELQVEWLRRSVQENIDRALRAEEEVERLKKLVGDEGPRDGGV